MSRQAAQRKLDHHDSLPIAADCAKFPDFPELAAMNRACDAWLAKRGLTIEFSNFGYGQKTNNNNQQLNTTNEETVL